MSIAARHSCLFLAWSGLALIALAGGEASADEPVPLQGRRVAGLRIAGGVDAVAHIDAPNRIQYFVGQGEKWKPTTVVIGSPLLVPGAPLLLTAIEGEELPQVLTVGVEGRFLQVTPRKAGPDVAPVAETLVPPGVRFPPAGDFIVARRPKRSCLFAIDQSGKLWEFDPQTSQPTLVEGRAELLVPGGAVRTMPDEGDELFLIDRRGNLVSYIRDPVVRWKGPQLIGAEFVAGADVVVWRRPDNKRELQVAAVNARGELHAGRLEPNGWTMEMAPGWVLSPGTPAGVAHTPVNMRFCAVTSRGILQEMTLVNTEWRERAMATGLAWKSSAVFLPNGPVAMGVDIAGNLVSATQSEEVWSTFVTTTDPTVETARLVQREWKRPAASATIEVELVNNSPGELLVRLRNRLRPADIVEVSVAPSRALKVELQLDSAGELEDLRRYTAADGTKTEQIKNAPTAIQSLYDVEVLAIRAGAVTYNDLRQKPWPAVSQRAKSPVSLGSFALPPGDALADGGRVDLLPSAETGRIVIVKP